MFAKEVHRVRLQAEADGLVIGHDMLGERHGRKAPLVVRTLVAGVG